MPGDATRPDREPLVLTVGHSTRSLEDFMALLAVHGVIQLVDVRTFPRSRHNPQFNRETLAEALEAHNVGYTYVAGLGGFRRTHPGSRNAGWRNLSFRGYADYMQTPAFAEHLADLIAWSRARRVVVMCAEAVPWRCHRSLIADALLVHGVRVEEILTTSRRRLHRLTPFARMSGTDLTYPPEPSSLPSG